MVGLTIIQRLWKVMFIAIEEPVLLTLHCEDDLFNMGMLQSMWNNEARPAQRWDGDLCLFDW